MRRVPLPGLAFWVALALTFAAVSLLLTSLWPGSPRGPQLGPKLETLDRRLDEVEVLFLGSSALMNQVDPALFDAELKSRGHLLHSFNLGLAGMRAPEAEELLRHIAAHRPARLRWVILDLEPDATRLHPENAAVRRVVAWHDGAATARVLELLARTDELPTAERWRRAWAHLDSAARHVSRLGRGAAAPRLGFDYTTPSLGPAGDGFVPLDWALTFEPPERASDFRSLQARRAALLENPRRLRRRAQALARGEAVAGGETASDVVALERLLATARRLGFEPVLVLGPRKNARAQVMQAVATGHLEPALTFNDPELYPWLYDPALRFDLNHLNSEGAERYTRLLAETFVEEVLPP